MNIKDFNKGWFIGDFEPSVFRTKEFDVGIKHCKKGDKNPVHHHKSSTEYTVIAGGEHQIGNILYKNGDICIIRPNESKGYECLESGAIVVVKVPSGKGDKYAD